MIIGAAQFFAILGADIIVWLYVLQYSGRR